MNAIEMIRSRSQSIDKLQRENKLLRSIALSNQDAPRKYRIDVSLPTNTLKYAVISDLHIGSKYSRTDALVEFITTAERMGIGICLVAGDLFEGTGVYRGQEYEVNALGYDEQFNKFVQIFKQIGKRMEFYFITGNHDASWQNSIGASIGKRIEATLSNWHYLGSDAGTAVFRLGNGAQYRVGLIHPGGGNSYALSYKVQKIIEALSGGQKPDALFIGHYHKAIWVPAYRNVDGFHAGTFQSQTPFMKKFASSAAVGGWVVEVIVGAKKNLTRPIKAEFVTFFEPEER